MTYDPLSYGQIKLGDRPATPADSPEDVLFDDAAPAPRAQGSGQDDADWALLDSDMDSLRPPASSDYQGSDFGADILGERMPVSAPQPNPKSKPATVKPKTHSMGSSLPQSPRVSSRVSPRTRSGPAPGAAPKVRSAPKSPTSRRRRPAPRAFRWVGTLVPSVVVACGGSAAAWFYMMEQNLVMAGMVGATTLVGAALARVMFR